MLVTARVDLVRQRPEEPPPLRIRQRVLEHLSDERMAEASAKPACPALGLHEVLGRQRLCGVGGRESRERVPVEGLAEGENFEHRALRRIELGEVVRQELREPRGDTSRRGPCPQPLAHGERARVEPALDQLTQEHRIPATRVPERVRGRGLDGTGEHVREEVGDLEAREGLELDAFADLVLPERDDRVGCRFTRSNRGEHTRFLRSRELVDERSRCRIECVGVASPSHELRAQRADRRRAERRGVWLRLDVRECTEWDRCRRATRHHALDVRAAIARQRFRFAEQARLADSGRPCDNGTSGIVQRSIEHRQLGVAADERPRCAGAQGGPAVHGAHCAATAGAEGNAGTAWFR